MGCRHPFSDSRAFSHRAGGQCTPLRTNARFLTRARAVPAPLASAQQQAVNQQTSSSRRAALSAMIAVISAASWELRPAQALPLAPLGGVDSIGGSKLTGLTVKQVKDILEKDLREGQYFVTGNLTLEVFADDCRFKDPTNDVTGLSRYKKALGLLFDPAYSVVRLRGIRVTGPRTIEADYVSGGYLRFPWHPRVEPYEGHIIYTLNEAGLVQCQEQTWSKPAATALLESFTPTPGPRTDIAQLQ